LFKTKDIIDMFDLSERTVRRHMRIGLLKGTKRSGIWVFSEDDIEKYLSCNILKDIVNLRLIRNYTMFLNGTNNLSKLTMISVNLSNTSDHVMKEISKKVGMFNNPMDFKCVKKSNHWNLTFYGNDEGIMNFLSVISAYS